VNNPDDSEGVSCLDESEGVGYPDESLKLCYEMYECESMHDSFMI
jgi:hypothetical protein